MNRRNFLPATSIKRRYVGIAILTTFFCALFWLFSFQIGIIESAKAFIVTIAIFAIVYLGAYLTWGDHE